MASCFGLRDAGGRRRARSARGFTLLELLVVLAILGLLAVIATPPVLRYLAQAKVNTARIQVQSLSGALDLFKLSVGRYPTTEEGLKALIELPASAQRWNGPYIKKSDSLTDPWGHPYIYKSPGEHGEFDLSSRGPESGEGGGRGQAITSW